MQRCNQMTGTVRPVHSGFAISTNLDRFRLNVGALLLVLLCAVSASAQKIVAGVGRTDITPPIGTPLAGYGARRAAPSTGVHDPTEARALIIDNGTEKI